MWIQDTAGEHGRCQNWSGCPDCTKQFLTNERLFGPRRVPEDLVKSLYDSKKYKDHCKSFGIELTVNTLNNDNAGFIRFGKAGAVKSISLAELESFLVGCKSKHFPNEVVSWKHARTIAGIIIRRANDQTLLDDYAIRRR